jgi:hypothetical protein
MYRRTLRYSGLIGLVAFTSFLILRTSETKAQSGTIKPVKAMTIVRRELVGPPEISKRIEIHTLFAVRADGAKVNRTLTTGRHHTGTEAWNVLLPSARTYTVVVDAIQGKSTMYVSPEAARAAGVVTLHPNCTDPSSKFAFVRQDTVNGFTAFEHITEEKDGELTRTTRTREWRAPDLDCRTIRLEQQIISPTGEVIHVFDRQAISIDLTEPDPQLFDVPVGYREMPPSQANRELIEFKTKEPFGSKAKHAGLLRGMQRMDEKYWQSQQLK